MTTTARHGEINGSPIRNVYRVQRDNEEKVRLFVTADAKIWIGYGDEPTSYSLVAYVGDRGTTGTGRDAICRAANCW